MNRKEIDRFINENRPLIDEYLGPNNKYYTAIQLKGELCVAMGKERAFSYFEALMNKNEPQEKQNSYMRALLYQVINNNKKIGDPTMRFGIDSKLLIGKEKQIFIEIMKEEFL